MRFSTRAAAGQRNSGAPSVLANLPISCGPVIGITSLVTYGPGELELAEGVRRSSDIRQCGAGQFIVERLSIHWRSARGFTLAATPARRTLRLRQAHRSLDCLGRPSGGETEAHIREDICVERNDIDCRVDCHRRSCSKWICMDIEVERVMEAVEPAGLRFA